MTVRITNLDSRTSCGTTTDENDSYEIPNLPAGHYRITIARAREYFAIESGRITLDNGSVDQFDFHFVRACAYVIAEEPTAGPRALAPADRGRYQPTYFPGTVYPFDRQSVAIGPDNPGEIRIVLVAGPKF